MKNFRLVGIIALAILLSACKQNVKEASYQVVPLPQEILPQDGANFILSQKTIVVFPADNEKMECNAEFLVEYLAQSVDYKLSTTNTETPNNSIVLKLGLESENPEAYQLTVNADQITIQGASEAGVFYGIQTLRKSIPAVAPKAKICFNPVVINDLPRFKYRGFHLDVARHFASIDFVKRTIDALAMHNLN
ncbi:MAG: beta-N-acetylhexosaminidase, partial [Paludibacteraceae bacterium]|nr:beta-N-acetylhexosaminidase [Paludibacteraceae bacterium]